ncbi:hypothetical protein FRC09_011797, partial [Ceratobasidium sp. 395]
RSHRKNRWDAQAFASRRTRFAYDSASPFSEPLDSLRCLALKFLPDGTDIPWHRVIASNGTISSRGPGTTGADRQRQALEDENVEVSAPGMGNGLMKVNIKEYGWFPDPTEVDIEIDDT